MKFLFSICLCVISLGVGAQSYPEPDFVEKPMYYHTATKELLPIERQVKPFKVEAAGFHQTFYYKDPQSPFRIKKSEGVQFLIKMVNSEELDLVLFVYPLFVSKGNRLIKIHVSLSSKDNNQGLVPFRYQKMGESLYLLTFDHIEPGEYVWYLKSASYLFGVE